MSSRLRDYYNFIENKRHKIINYGINPVWAPDMLFDFQRHIFEIAIKRGRMGVFLDTGLGKTIIALTIAYNIVLKTNKKVLVLTPLAVAFQFLEEAKNIGIDDIEYCKDGKHSKKIVICNYERLHYFDSSSFECVVCDESSILKNFNGKTKLAVTGFVRKINYRYLMSATPSPNSFTELGTSSEALGYLGYMDMLSHYFHNARNDADSRHKNIGDSYYLKKHAETDFFAWVNTWAVMVRKPCDVGYANDRYTLPKLNECVHFVDTTDFLPKTGKAPLFALDAVSMGEVRKIKKGQCRRGAKRRRKKPTARQAFTGAI